MAIGIAPIVGEFQLQGHCLQGASARHRSIEKSAPHRTRRAARADEITAAEHTVHYKIVAVPSDVSDAMLYDLGAGALEQPGVELDPSNGMLHTGQRHTQTAQVPVQPPEAQETMRILGDFQPQIAHHLGCDPTGAQLQPREALPVEHDHVVPRRFQTTRRCRPCRTAADDDGVDATHRGATHRSAAAQLGYMYSRVSGMALLSCLVNST